MSLAAAPSVDTIAGTTPPSTVDAVGRSTNTRSTISTPTTKPSCCHHSAQRTARSSSPHSPIGAPLEVGDAQRFAGGLELVVQHAVGRRGVAEVDDDDVEAQLRERRVLVHADVGALAGEQHVGVRAVGVRQPCPVAERSVDAGVGELAVHRRPVDEGTRTERRVRLDRGVGRVGKDAGQPGPGRVEVRSIRGDRASWEASTPVRHRDQRRQEREHPRRHCGQ